jgi:ribosome biogenesis GTPase / thiamine phosphate phosphatase
MSKNRRKIRTEFRKNHDERQRADWTRRYQSGDAGMQDEAARERMSGKGDLTRKRTVLGDETASEASGFDVLRDVAVGTIGGRVLSVHGLASRVMAEDGRLYQCSVRGVLKSMSTELRHVVATGDRVVITPGVESEAVIERVEPRISVICRTSKNRRHILVSNVERVLIVSSAAEPRLKPNLIDRLLVTAEKHGIEPLICINKVDLIDPADLQPLVGVYGQLGYPVVLVSATKAWGVVALREFLRGRQSVVTGQSGVGKSSILNSIESGLGLSVGEVSEENQKGKHTTTSASLIPLSFGGFVVDTPGVRQFQLWDVIPEEVAGYYREIRPFINGCKYPNCSHTHELECAVKGAVADNQIDVRRYESYCGLYAGDVD